MNNLKKRILNKIITKLLKHERNSTINIEDIVRELKIDEELTLETLKDIEKIGIVEIKNNTIILKEDKASIMVKLLKFGYMIDLERISRDLSWNDFEKLIKIIFREFNFNVIHKVRFPINSHRFEVDMIAIKDSYIFMIDAKRYLKSRIKVSDILDYVNSIESLCKKFRQELITRLGLKSGIYEIYPTIITVHEHVLNMNLNILIIPIWKLRSFIENFHDIKDVFLRFYLYVF